jgi:hypothetical protein
MTTFALTHYPSLRPGPRPVRHLCRPARRQIRPAPLMRVCRMRQILAFITALFFALPLMANETGDTSLKRFLQERYGNIENITHSEGKLKSRTGIYVAVVMSQRDAAEDSLPSRVIVLKKNNSGYGVVAEGKIWVEGSNGWSVFLKNGYLFLSTDQSCGSVCHSSTSFQFSCYKHACNLTNVGESLVEGDFEQGLNGKFNLATSTKNINFLLRTITYTSELCPASENNPWYCTGKTRSFRKKLTFYSAIKWDLTNFSPDEFAEYEARVPHLNGHIDKDLRYHEE